MGNKEKMTNREHDLESEQVEKHIRNYYALLRSSGELYLRVLEQSHAEMESNLHRLAESGEVDISAFLYAAKRLPDCMDRISRVVMGQNDEVFKDGGIGDILNWQNISSKARNRLVLFDGNSTLAVYVCSLSDIDDLIPSLTALQIEWNKMHRLLSESPLGNKLADGEVKAAAVEGELKKILRLSHDDWELIKEVWGENWDRKIAAIASAPKNIKVCLLAGGFSDYRRAVQNWWEELIRRFKETLIEFRPVYIISSNTHSISNLLSGFASNYREKIIDHTLTNDTGDIKRHWKMLEADNEEGPQANFVYYAMRDFIDSDKESLKNLRKMEEEAGILHYHPSPYLDLRAQLIDLRKLVPDRMDKRLSGKNVELLSKSRAMIINIEYPLGFAAYHILSQMLSSVKEIRGIYIMGKSGTICGRIGDIIIPNVVYDTLSRNLFFFKNCFSVKDIIGYLNESAVFDNQKSVSVRGTFLQNQDSMKIFHKDDYNGIEMEAGPYLCALYEDLYPDRYPVRKSINLPSEDIYDIGILHYASDTPYSRRESLLSRRLGYAGVEATYGCSIALLRRIFKREIEYIKEAALES